MLLQGDLSCHSSTFGCVRGEPGYRQSRDHPVERLLYAIVPICRGGRHDPFNVKEEWKLRQKASLST
jgi:hypothetical protein